MENSPHPLRPTVSGGLHKEPCPQDLLLSFLMLYDKK